MTPVVRVVRHGVDMEVGLAAARSTARVHSLKDLERYGFEWHRGLEVDQGSIYRGIPLVDMLAVDVHLMLRERWLGGRAREIPWKRKVIRAARTALVRWGRPELLLRVEARRIPASWALPTPTPNRRVALVVVQGRTESDLGTLLPVIRGLESRKGWTPLVVTADAAAAARLRKEGVRFTNLLAFPGDVRSYGRAARTFLRSLRSAARKAPPDHGLLPEMARTGILEDLALRYLVLQQVLDAAEAVFALPVEVVVTASDVHPVGKSLVTFARGQGIRTVVIQNGMYGEGPEAITVGFLPVSAATVCVWGEGSARVLMAHGISRERIRLTGQPRFDRLVAMRGEPTRAGVSRELRIPQEGPLVTFASQNIFRSQEEVSRVLRGLGSVGETVPRASVVVKLHPAEDPFLWERARAIGSFDRITVIREADLHQLLTASDVVITVFSTVGLESLLLGSRLVILEHDRSDEMRYVEFGAALPASLDRLGEVVRSALEDPDDGLRLAEGTRRFVEHYASGIDGRATERVLDAVCAAASVP